MADWVSVKDHLPQYNAEYLVCHYRGPLRYCPMQVSRYDTKTKTWHGASPCSILYDVTHWREKPEPPKGDV